MWNEVVADAADANAGAHNFLTGAGGFLQSLFAGYAGLKVRLDGLHVDRPRLPANVSRLSLTGMFLVFCFCFVLVGVVACERQTAHRNACDKLL